MPLDERIDVRQRRRHAARERGVARRDLQRVDPDHSVGDAVEPNHLLGEHSGVAAVNRPTRSAPLDDPGALLQRTSRRPTTRALTYAAACQAEL